MEVDSTAGQPLLASPSGERKCVCVKNHNPEPRELHRHHVWPTGKGGPDISENLLWLCPTTHSNVHMLWREYEKCESTPPWETRRQFSNYCQQVVHSGWIQKVY
jgi:hypothetical protein